MTATHTSHRHHVPSQAELQEMTRICKPEFGIGFAYNSDYIQPGEFERWYGTLPQPERDGLRDGAKSVLLVAQASHSGSKEYNQKLSERRAQAVATRLKQLPGFAAKIVVKAVGESQAHGPEGKDNHQDRRVFISVQSSIVSKEAGDVDLAVADVYDKRLRPNKSRAAQQQMGILYDVAVKPLKKSWKKLQTGDFRNPKELIPQYKPQKMIRDFLMRELNWMGKQMVADIKDTQTLPRLTASTPWGVINGLEVICGVAASSFNKGLFFSPTFYLAGVNMAATIWDALDESEKKNLKLVLADPKKRAEFTKKEVERLVVNWNHRGYDHASREFRTGLDDAMDFLDRHGI